MEVVTGGQHKLYHQFGSGAAAPLVGRGGQSVQVDYGLGERAQDFESDGPGCKSQLCPAWTGLLISLGGVQTCECCAGAEMGSVGCGPKCSIGGVSAAHSSSICR